MQGSCHALTLCVCTGAAVVDHVRAPRGGRRTAVGWAVVVACLRPRGVVRCHLMRKMGWNPPFLSCRTLTQASDHARTTWCRYHLPHSSQVRGCTGGVTAARSFALPASAGSNSPSRQRPPHQPVQRWVPAGRTRPPAVKPACAGVHHANQPGEPALPAICQSRKYSTPDTVQPNCIRCQLRYQIAAHEHCRPLVSMHGNLTTCLPQ